MDLNQATPPYGRVFTFTEELEEGPPLQAHSHGNGRFTQGIPNEDCEVSFRLYKEDENSLDIQIYDDNLFKWLRTIPDLRDELDRSRHSISMNTLLPCYSEVREMFAQCKRGGPNFDPVELFVRHFLVEGSVFAIFGFEYLHENDILTELHFHDIQSQFRSISEDLDLLDEAIDKLEAEDIEGPSPVLMKEPTQFQSRASITLRDHIAWVQDSHLKTRTALLRINTWSYGDIRNVPLYRVAKVGDMDAVRLFLSYSKDKVRGRFHANEIALTGAVCGGHLEIIRYLVEEKGASVNGKCGISPLSRALQHNHTHIVGYLLRAGADVPDLEGIDHPDIAEILRECGLDSDLMLHPTLLDKLLRLAASFGDIDAVEYLINAGVDVNPKSGDPLRLAVKYGGLEVVRLLVRAGANVNPRELRARFERSPLAEAVMRRKAEVAHFLSSAGATLLEGEYQLRTNLQRKNLYRAIGRCNQSVKGIEYKKRSETFVTIAEFLQQVKNIGCFEEEQECPAVAAVRAQERRITERRLFANVTSSWERLLDAGATQYASGRLREFVAKVGTSSSVFKSGTRAIRDISEGYKPSSLRAIVSALQVADAMRSVVPASKLVYSKKEFLDDIPRWASLLSPGDQHLFDEISHHLWGVPGSKSAQEGVTSFAWEGTLMFLQELINNLVRTSGLFDHGSGSSCDPCRLQSLRQKHLSARRHESETRYPLTEWCPSPPPQVQMSVHSDERKPPDQSGETSALARITVLMAGAIFGVILLYLCLSQYGFSIPSLLLLASNTRQGWASGHIVARNCVILAFYIRFTPVVDSLSWNSNDNVLPNPTPMPLVLPDTPTTERVQEHIAAGQPSCEGDWTMIDSPSVVDYTTEDRPSGCSPSPSSHLTTSPSATTISFSTGSATTPDSTTPSTSEGGMIHCRHCKSTFQLGKNGRRGQASNLRKHMKSHHPDTLPN